MLLIQIDNINIFKILAAHHFVNDSFGKESLPPRNVTTCSITQLKQGLSG